MSNKPRKDRPLRRALFTRLGRLFTGKSAHPDSGLFLLFNHAVIGGADFVHLRITRAVADLKPTVLFTLNTSPQPLAPQFAALAHVEQPGLAIKGHTGRYYRIGQLAARINRCDRPVVLGGHSRLFYELLPLLRRDARCVDLVHAMATLEHLSLPYAHLLTQRVFISAKVRDEYAALYDRAGLDPALKSRMTVIENCVDVPEAAPAKDAGPLRVLFVGRGAPEKRLHLVGRIAAECRRRGLPVEFDLVGDCEPVVDAADRPACRFAGMLSGPDAIAPFYDRAQVLLLTSSMEGFPLVVQEAMARAVVPVCTDVGGMARHVLPGSTGVLLPPNDEAAVVTAGVQALTELATDRARLARLAAGAFARAAEHFGPRQFLESWRRVLARG
ncbi:MAG: glycosyltransferase family 4 protein [Planctomycetes bacterium]|nr:glycosyltransferase family 4 protein [Planctomycetota bacterium]